MKEHIKISTKYPGYWEYDGKPVVLLGGSKEDNLFQIPDIEEHLKLLKSVGGNYVRCTMSSRDEGDVWPHEKIGDKYDLNKFSEEYWYRFKRFLDLTYSMDIILQIEVWDRFDFVRDPWQENSFNPKNNCNYTSEESKLKENIDTHPNKNESRFFFTIPEEDNNELVLKYQQAFVDKMLEYSLNYPNVLYCMDNETAAVEGWGRYWSQYIKKKAEEKGIIVHTTEMWDKWDLRDEQHNSTFDHPETYSFCDISQNNHNSGDEHWNGILYVRERIRNHIRPLNTVKIYGADTGRFGTDKDAIERFWKNIMGGLAATRFHRPPSGLGLSAKAQTCIKSARMLLEQIDIFNMSPDNSLFIERSKDNSYCCSDGKSEAVVFFSDKGRAVLKNIGFSNVRWLDIMQSSWLEDEAVKPGNEILLETPGEGFYIALLKA